ncbi:MAG: hypothetical protein EOP48_04045, partial [Sphingobacteriales bacterium]
NNPAIISQLEDLLANNNDPNAPKAHLSYLFFNEKLELLPGNSGIIQVPVGISGWTSLSPAIATGQNGGVTAVGQVTALEPGYIIVYVDNQSVGKDVWFDNLMIGHYTGEVLEQSHYYPFGLTVDGPMAAGVTEQPLKLTTKELEKSFDLNAYDFGARMQDMQLGRWWGADPLAEKYYPFSPYNFCVNNPTNFIDLFGEDVYIAIWYTAKLGTLELQLMITSK